MNFPPMLGKESIGVIFSAIGKELLLPILCEVTKLKVADWDEPFNSRFDNTNPFYGSLSALHQCCWWCEWWGSVYFTYLLTK